MNQDWILQRRETRRFFNTATWVPLRASTEVLYGPLGQGEVGHVSETFTSGSVAFSPEHRELAEGLGSDDIGLFHSAQPYAYEDGYYSTIDQYQFNDKEPVGIELVFEYDQPVVGSRLLILNPDLVVALRLIKEGNNWLRPEEDFIVVAREIFDDAGNPSLIEIRREFLMDYLAARNLSLRVAYFRQRLEIVPTLEESEYVGLESFEEQRDGGRFELLVRSMDDIYGGSWAVLRTWRTDVDEEDDAPAMGPESDDNTGFESSRGHRTGYAGIRVESNFWREEWIDHQGQSVRVRHDADRNLPLFIVETDGTRMPSDALNNEDVGRWLWFRSSIVNELLGHRGFSIRWYTAETGGICSTSGHVTHFGVNASDLITVYAYDVACLNPWEQHIWASHNVVPDGKVSAELLASQVKAEPASTHAVEVLLFKSMRMLEAGFGKKFQSPLFTHDIDDEASMQVVSRFTSADRASLLRLAKELIRVFSDRLNKQELRKLSTHIDKETLGSNKLLEDIVAQKIGPEKAREVFGVIAGTYDLRLGDAHPTSSKIADALKLAKVGDDQSSLKQGKQLINNFGHAIWMIGKVLFGEDESQT